MKLFGTVSAMIFVCSLLSGAAEEKYANPALHKVRFEKPLFHAPLEMVKNGQLNFAIVCDLAAEKKAVIAGTNTPIRRNRESLRISSGLLQKYLEQSFGKRPEILPPGSPKLSGYRYKIFLGKSAQTDKLGIDISKMPPDGFKVMTSNDGIVIAGRDGSLIPGSYQWNELGYYAENGTAGAVFDFLERFLGMRFYYPGLGTVVPEKKDFTIFPVAYTDHPKYLTRHFGRPTGGFHKKGAKPVPLGLGHTSEWPWEDIPDNQGDFNAAYRMESRPTRWMCSEGPNPFVVAKAFPDKLDICFYRDKTGRLHQSFTQYTANYFDVSNLKFADLLADSFEQFYQTHGKVNRLWDNSFRPDPEYMYFGPVDAGCVIENERTAKLPKRTEDYSKMSEVNAQFYLYLANRLKKTLPGKKISFMAYSNYLGAPKSVERFPDNVRIMACTGTPVFIRSKAAEQFWKELYSDWNSKISGKVMPYPYDPAYNMQGGISHALRGYFEGEFLRKMAPHISDFALFPCVYFRWDYYYSNYLISRAYWNPDLDVDAILNEHWKLLYGPAAPHLKAFYDLLVDRWVNHYIPNAKIGRGCIPGLDYATLYKKAYPPEVTRKMQDFLNKARASVKKGSVEERRLSFFTLPWTRIMNEAAAYKSVKTPAPCKVIYSQTPMNVDGKLDEAVWKRAASIPFKSAYYGESKKLRVPDAKVVWTKEGIYLGIFNPAPYKKIGKLWGEDNVEFFISPGLSRNKLFQFVLSSTGEFEDYFQSFDPPRELESSWRCKNLKKAVHSDEKGWTCEMFIPFASLDNSAAPLAGDSWYANLINNRTDCETTSYSPTLGNNRNLNFYAKFHFAGNCE